jgi:hypothetical protein
MLRPNTLLFGLAKVAELLPRQLEACVSLPFQHNTSFKILSQQFVYSVCSLSFVIHIANPVAAALAMVIIPVICKNENGDDMPITVSRIYVSLNSHLTEENLKPKQKHIKCPI